MKIVLTSPENFTLWRLLMRKCENQLTGGLPPCYKQMKTSCLSVSEKKIALVKLIAFWYMEDGAEQLKHLQRISKLFNFAPMKKIKFRTFFNFGFLNKLRFSYKFKLNFLYIFLYVSMWLTIFTTVLLTFFIVIN